MYGRSLDRLSVVCEDEAAEALVRGIFDALVPELGMVQGDIEIGRDTGKQEFKHHVAAFAQFRKLWSTIFVLDGDGQNLVAKLESMAQSKGQVAAVICLPGDGSPELWAWHAIEDHPRDYAQRLGFSDEAALQVEMQHISQTYEGAADSESNKAKGRIWALTQATGRDVPALMRMMGRIEAERDSGELASVLADFRDAVLEWRNMRGDF